MHAPTVKIFIFLVGRFTNRPPLCTIIVRFPGGASPSPTGCFFVRGNSSVFGMSRAVSLRLGLARVLTVHRTVIHSARAASLHPLPQFLIFTVGAIHESPAFMSDNRLFFGRRQANSASLRGKFASQKLPLPYRFF